MLRSINSGGSTKTVLMYRAYLSYRQMQGYLKLLQERELISYQFGTRMFQITGKGVGRNITMTLSKGSTSTIFGNGVGLPLTLIT
jgi:predicted transcriptional regulator